MGEIITSCIETFIVYSYFNLVLKSEPEEKNKRIIGALVISVIISTLSLVGVDSTIKGMFAMCIQTMYAVLCFKGSSFEKLFYGGSFAVIAVAADHVTFRIGGILPIEKLNEILEPGVVRYEMMIVYYLACLTFISIMVFFSRKRMTLPLRYLIVLSIIIVCGLISLDKLLNIVIGLDGIREYEKIKGMVEITSIFLFAVLLSIIYIIIGLASVYQERNELQEIRHQEESALKEYELIKESTETLRGWRHDLRNHLHMVMSLIQGGKTEEAEDYIVKISGEMESGTFLINSGSQILDAAITNKFIKAKSLGIEFTCEIHIEGRLPLSPSEVTSMFGNLLDNAIEANMKLSEEKRFINVTLSSNRKMIQIVIKNSSDGIYIKTNGKFSSRKREGEGVGLKQVKKILDKHSGFLWSFDEDDCFQISILIPSENGEEDYDSDKYSSCGK